MRHAGNAVPVQAGIYCRISRAVDGDTTKTDDQERICRDLAKRLGWEIAEGCGHPEPNGVYTDHSKSAWQLNRKREAWDRMLADIDAGRLPAMIVYHGDRLIGRPEDLATLLRISRSKGILLASPTGDRDLSNPDDEFVMWVEAAMKGRESANLSRRRKAQYERWRQEGRVFSGGAGGRRFGFETDGVTHRPADRCEVGTRREVSEADIIREAAGRILAGESSRSVAKDLTARTWTSVAGKRLDGQDVRRMLMLPRYAGLMPDGETKAAWEPVLDRETWERVRLVLEATANGYDRSQAQREARHLLSGIAECGACETPLQIAYASSKGYKSVLYGCGRRDGCGKVFRSQPLLDAYVTVRTVARLNDPRNPEPQMPAPDTAPEWAALTTERAATEKLAKDYAASPGRLSLLMARLDSIDARMAELRDREAGDARSRLLGTHQGITAEEFAALPLAVRRALVAACFRVVVLPASGRGPGFRTEDVRLEPLG